MTRHIRVQTHHLARQHYERENRRTIVIRITHIAGIILALAILMVVFSLPVNGL